MGRPVGAQGVHLWHPRCPAEDMGNDRPRGEGGPRRAFARRAGRVRGHVVSVGGGCVPTPWVEMYAPQGHPPQPTVSLNSLFPSTSHPTPATRHLLRHRPASSSGPDAVRPPALGFRTPPARLQNGYPDRSFAPNRLAPHPRPLRGLEERNELTQLPLVFCDAHQASQRMHPAGSAAPPLPFAVPKDKPWAGKMYA